MKDLVQYIKESLLLERIKPLPNNIKGLIVFDIDDTILKVDSKLMSVYKNEPGKPEQKLSTEEFAKDVYDDVEKHNFFITNLGKCTQIDARPLPDSVYKEYLHLLEKEIELINPKVIILFGNQVSSIVLNEKISVSQCRKQKFIKEINHKKYDCYSVFYPVGNGRFNIGKSIEDIKYIINSLNKN